MGKKRAREADGAAKDPDKMVEDDSSDDDVSEPAPTVKSILVNE